jgi:hypothetical protein
MKPIALGLSAAALLLVGTAFAAPADDAARSRDAARDRIVTRAEVATQATRLFARLDANHDGNIDRTDREARQELRRKARFDRLDADRNGELTREEFTARRGDGQGLWRFGRDQAMQRGPLRRGMMMGRMADTDGDRAVTQAEFVAAALRRFDRLDANHDGRVTRAERQPARRQMRPDMRSRMARPPAS